MIVLQQLKLSIEESHNANDGNAKGCGEKHYVEHLFLLVSGLGLGQTDRFCSSYYKPDWSDNRPARPAGQIHRTAVVLSKNTAHNWQAMGPGVNPLQLSQSQRSTPLKAPGNTRPPHQTNISIHTNATSDAPAIAIGAHWSRRTRVITTKQLTQ